MVFAFVREEKQVSRQRPKQRRERGDGSATSATLGQELSKIAVRHVSNLVPNRLVVQFADSAVSISGSTARRSSRAGSMSSRGASSAAARAQFLMRAQRSFERQTHEVVAEAIAS